MRVDQFVDRPLLTYVLACLSSNWPMKYVQFVWCLAAIEGKFDQMASFLHPSCDAGVIMQALIIVCTLERMLDSSKGMLFVLAIVNEAQTL